MQHSSKCARSALIQAINRVIAMVRAKAEHPFRVIKRHFGHVKTRYHGLAMKRAVAQPQTLCLEKTLVQRAESKELNADWQVTWGMSGEKICVRGGESVRCNVQTN